MKKKFKKIVKRGRPAGSTNRPKMDGTVAVETNTTTLALHVLNLASSIVALREDLRQVINHFANAGAENVKFQGHVMSRLNALDSAVKDILTPQSKATTAKTDASVETPAAADTTETGIN